MLEPGDIDVLILCGGLGKRLRRVLTGRPKPLALINGRPFLDILIGYVKDFGFRRFILCAGYKAGVIERYYDNFNDPSRSEVLVSREKKLLGTAGAIKNAEPFIRSSVFLAMNGDSLCKVDLKKFLAFHSRKKARISLALTRIKDTSDYGKVSLGDSGRITGFSEKSRSTGYGLVSSGIYLFQKRALALIPAHRKVSLEKDFFPRLVSKGIYGYITDSVLIDIGTPERYKIAQKLIRRVIYEK